MRWTALRFRRRVIDPDTSNEPAISVDPDCPVDRAPDVSSLWIAAIKQYHRSLDVDLQDPSLSFIDSLRYCSTAEEILDVLQSTSSCLHNKRQGSKTSRTLRDVLKPVVYGLLAILDVGAEAASSTGVPGGKSIFAAIAVLLKAADSVRAAYDDLEKLFERLEAYVKRLQVRLQAPMRSGAREVAVTSLVEMLKALALATKMVRRNRVELFLRALFTRSSEVRAAIQDLEVLVSDEEKMAVTDVVVGMHELSSQVLDVNTAMSRLVDVSGSTTETVQAMVDEIRENERQRSSDNEAILALLGAIAGGIGLTIQYEAMPSRQSHSPTLITDAQTNAYHHLRQGTDQVSTGLQSAHEDMTRQVIPRRPPVNLTSETIRQLRSAISRFSTGDQDIIYRTVSTLFSWALESVNGRYSAATCLTVATTHTTVHWSVAETFLSLFCTFLVLFIMFKLGSITRNFGFAPGTVIVIGLCDEIFVLDSETFSSWENTHAYLLRAFQGRLGVSYIEKRDYALGDSEHLFIEQHKWSVIVKAGSRLHMSVVVHGNGARCPYCGAVSVSGNDLNIDDRFLCSRCGRLYGALQGASVEDDDYPFNRPSAPVTSSYDEDDEAVPTMGPFHRVIVALDMQDVPAMSQGENVRRDTESQSLQVGELQETNTTSGARVVAGDSYAGDHNNTEETHVPAMPSHLFSEPGPSQDSRLLLRNVRRRPGVVYFANGNDAGGKGGSRPGAMTRRIGAITVQHHQTIQPAFSLSDPTFLPRKNRNKS